MGSKEESKEIILKKVGGPSIFHIIGNVAKQVGTVAVIYLLGYYNISPAWLLGPLILSVIRDEWKKEKEIKRNIAKAAAMSNEKEVILARIDELPAWVFFPDVERAEWVNRILFQVWPNVNHYAKEVIKDVIEPNIELALAEYKLSGFSFQKMRLGTIPPRIGGIKVYDRNVSRTEIIMDIDLFYAGDCDISFTLGGLSGGIKDFQIHGLLRIVMKPLLTTMPLVGGLQIFFLNNPTIDFNLVGVVDLLDMPGLSDLLRRVIVEQMAAIMVLPNKLPITLSDAVPAQSLKIPEPEGVIRVHVVEAKQLMKKDIGMLSKGKSDPYAIITVGAQTFKTKTIDNTVDPKWDFWCEFSIDALIGQVVTVTVMDEDHSKKDSFLGRRWAEIAKCCKFLVDEGNGQFLVIRVFDKDNAANDDPLGRATVEACNVIKRGVLDTWVSLEEAKTGMVHLRMTWLKFSTDLADLQLAIAETQQLRLTHMSTALLIVFVDSAKNLPCPRGGAKPDPSIQLSVAKTSHNSNIIYRTDCPVYEQGFTFLVHNPETDTLHLKVVDQKTGADLGYLSYNLRQLLDKEKMELDDQPLRLLKAGPESKVILSMRLRILKFIPVNEAEVASEPEKVEPDVPETTPLIAENTVVDNVPKHVPVAEFVDKEASGDMLSASVDEKTVQSTPAPKSETEPAATLHQRTLSTTSSSGEFGLGRIQITLRYSVQRQRLVIVVHKVANLPLKDPSSIPDPYVKLYLLPERAKDTKRKTESVKDNCNPIYDETFEYVISQAELNGRQLEVTVLSQKTWKSPVMGQVIIPLGNEDLKLSKAVTAWYDLQPGNDS